MKKQLFAAALLALGLSGVGLAQPLLNDAPRSLPLELSLFGGFSLSKLNGLTSYADQWGWNLLQSVTEGTRVTTSDKTGYTVGEELTWYITPSFGLQLLFSYAKADISSVAACTFSWTWADGTSASRTASWPGTGTFKTMPLSLDFVGRVSSGRLDGSVSAGVTLFMSSLTQSSSFGYGITTITDNSDGTYTQQVDALQVGLTLPASAMKKTIVGINFGGALTWMFTDAIGVRAAARYYYCPSQILSWDFVTGTYNGVFFGDIKNEPFDSSDIALLRQTSNTFALTIQPSFVQVTFGLVFSLSGSR